MLSTYGLVLDSPVRSRVLDSVILMDPFQLETLSGSTSTWEEQTKSVRFS